MSEVVETLSLKTGPTSSEDFAKWAFGASLDELDGKTPGEAGADEAEDAPDAAPEGQTDAEVEGAAADDGAGDDTDAPGDAAAVETPDPEPVKLPFEAKAKDAPVDTTLLSTMEVTFKADGKEVTLPLADVVRRAQSEPAVQRQARAAAAEVQQLQQMLEQERDLSERRAEIALRMARDPDFWTTVSSEVQSYDTPEARAERAEQALAAERQRIKQEQEQASFARAVESFAIEHVAPALDAIMTAAPLVTEEEVLGRFYADTAKWTVNGIIDPRHHPELAAYLKTELKEFALSRQAKRSVEVQKAQAEARKSQVERQKMKNQTAQAVKPPTSAGAPLRTSSGQFKPKSAKEAEASALAVLLNGA